MSNRRYNIMLAAKKCLGVRVNCPKDCPLFKTKKCQKVIFLEALKMYKEMTGVDFGEGIAEICAKEAAQEETPEALR